VVVLIFKDVASNQGDIVALGVYLPKRRGANTEHDEQSMQILRLKARNRQAIASYYSIIEPLLGQGFSIAVIPSCDSTKTMSGIRDLAQLLARNSRIDATSCLVRHTTIPKLAHGGDRGVEVHSGSINVVNINLIRDREVLLLDDITTTGNSFKACRILIEKNGATLVRCLALAETVSYVDEADLGIWPRQ
jgi:predicted amidophosphoribosyltransferase